MKFEEILQDGLKVTVKCIVFGLFENERGSTGEEDWDPIKLLNSQ